MPKCLLLNELVKSTVTKCALNVTLFSDNVNAHL